jgi:hypothetical protein
VNGLTGGGQIYLFIYLFIYFRVGWSQFVILKYPYEISTYLKTEISCTPTFLRAEIFSFLRIIGMGHII